MIGNPDVAEFQGKPYEMGNADSVSRIGHYQYEMSNSQIRSVDPPVHKDSPINVRMGNVPKRRGLKSTKVSRLTYSQDKANNA